MINKIYTLKGNRGTYSVKRSFYTKKQQDGYENAILHLIVGEFDLPPTKTIQHGNTSPNKN